MSGVSWRRALRIRARWALIRLRRPTPPAPPDPDQPRIAALLAELDQARAELDSERDARLDADERAATAYATAARYQAALGPDGDEIMRLRAAVDQVKTDRRGDADEIMRLKAELDQTRMDLMEARRAARWRDHWDQATVEISHQAPGDATLPLRAVRP